MKYLIIFAALFSGLLPAMAQQPSEQTPSRTSTRQAEPLPVVPQYAYCEIIGSAMPSLNGHEVLFDFGQPTEYWRPNYLRNTEGQRIVFNSNIEALNYMTCWGWEFVQAYTSGTENQTAHLLLRIPTGRLSDEQLQQLLTEPRTKPGDKKK